MADTQLPPSAPPNPRDSKYQFPYYWVKNGTVVEIVDSRFISLSVKTDAGSANIVRFISALWNSENNLHLTYRDSRFGRDEAQTPVPGAQLAGFDNTVADKPKVGDEVVTEIIEEFPGHGHTRTRVITSFKHGDHSKEIMQTAAAVNLRDETVLHRAARISENFAAVSFEKNHGDYHYQEALALLLEQQVENCHPSLTEVAAAAASESVATATFETNSFIDHLEHLGGVTFEIALAIHQLARREGFPIRNFWPTFAAHMLPPVKAALDTGGHWEDDLEDVKPVIAKALAPPPDKHAELYKALPHIGLELRGTSGAIFTRDANDFYPRIRPLHMRDGSKIILPAGILVADGRHDRVSLTVKLVDMDRGDVVKITNNTTKTFVVTSGRETPLEIKPGESDEERTKLALRARIGEDDMNVISIAEKPAG